jgi:hypothetical protein
MAADADEEKGPASGDASQTDAAERLGVPRQRPSVTIDLTAAEIPAEASSPAETGATAKSEAQEATGEQPKTAEPRPVSDGPGAAQYSRPAAAKAFSADDGFRRNLAVGAVGGLVALIVVLVLQSVSILPAPGRSAARQAIQQAKAASDATTALDRRLSAVEAMTEAISGMRGDIKALSDRVAALETIRPALASVGDVTTVSANLAALTKRVDSVPPAATRDDLAALSDRLSKLEAAAAGGGDSASTGAMAALTGQLNDAETQLRALTDRVNAAEAKAAAAPSAGSDVIRAVAMASLRRAADSGEPFGADVDLVAGLGIGGDDIATLRQLAAKGVETRAALAAAFPQIADAILSASAEGDPNAGFFSRLVDDLRGLVVVRPLGPVAGSDPPAIVSRMRDDVSKGDLAGALAERGGLTEAGKNASADWAAKAADRVSLDAAVARIAGTLDAAKAG